MENRWYMIVDHWVKPPLHRQLLTRPSNSSSHESNVPHEMSGCWLLIIKTHVSRCRSVSLVSWASWLARQREIVVIQSLIRFKVFQVEEVLSVTETLTAAEIDITLFSRYVYHNRCTGPVKIVIPYLWRPVISYTVPEVKFCRKFMERGILYISW